MKKQSSLINSSKIITLGDHTLVCGDSSDISLVKQAIAWNRIDLLLTDPPYGISYVKSKNSLNNYLSVNKVIQNDTNIDPKSYRDFSSSWLNPIRNFQSDKNSFYIFNSDKMLSPLFESLANNGFTFSQLLIWIKNQSVIGRKDYNPQHELILYGWYKNHKFYKAKDKSVLFHPKPLKSKLHPTMKPISLLRRIILNSTEIGDVVYDPFGGSGSTLIACEQTKRKCIMFEIDPQYCQVIINRYQKLIGAKNE